MQKIGTCLWFDGCAEEAARFYVALFKNSKLGAITHYTEVGPRRRGEVLTVSFELEGREFVALNGGPEFNFTQAISLVVNCYTQGEVDEMWSKLLEGGKPSRCGWLKDKFGVSWQVIPAVLYRMQQDPDEAKVNRMLTAMLKMTKLDLPTLQAAFEGKQIQSAAAE